MLRITAVILFALTLVAGASAQTSAAGGNGESEITVSADATVSSQPDLAEFHLGIVSRQPLATEAYKVYAKTYEALIKSISIEFDSTKLRTGNLTIAPHFSDKNPEQITPEYYQVAALMSLSVPISKLNAVLGQITSVEGVTENGIQFLAANQDSLQNTALGQAVRNARERAETIAGSEHLKNLRVKTMTTSLSRPPVPFYGPQIELSRMSPYLNVSEVTVSASITVTYEASQN